MYYAVDRIEGETAILFSDDGKRLEVSVNELPEISEGDILLFDGNIFTLVADERQRRTVEMKKKLGRLNIKNKRK